MTAMRESGAVARVAGPQEDTAMTSGLTREELLAEVQRLRTLSAQLQEALDSRVVIEQAKGILSERLAISIEDAFALLRYAARSHRTKLHLVARRVVEERQTPAPVVVANARASRVRAASMRERAEAHRERREYLGVRLEEQRNRLRGKGPKQDDTPQNGA